MLARLEAPAAAAAAGGCAALLVLTACLALPRLCAQDSKGMLIKAKAAGIEVILYHWMRSNEYWQAAEPSWAALAAGPYVTVSGANADFVVAPTSLVFSVDEWNQTQSVNVVALLV